MTSTTHKTNLSCEYVPSEGAFVISIERPPMGLAERKVVPPPLFPAFVEGVLNDPEVTKVCLAEDVAQLAAVFDDALGRYREWVRRN